MSPLPTVRSVLRREWWIPLSYPGWLKGVQLLRSSQDCIRMQPYRECLTFRTMRPAYPTIRYRGKSGRRNSQIRQLSLIRVGDINNFVPLSCYATYSAGVVTWEH